MIVYIPIDRKDIFFHNVYYTESEQFMAHAQERIPRKGGTTYSPRKGGERRLPTTRRAISCMPSISNYTQLWAGMQINSTIDYKGAIRYTVKMHIEFYPASEHAEIIVPVPKPAKNIIPNWYKDIKGSNDIKFRDDGANDSEAGIKRCMPFFDGLTSGYIQESWTDIYIKRVGDNIQYSFPQGPTIIELRDSPSIHIPDQYYNLEFVWKMQWLPKMPKGWSMFFTSPNNRIDLPFRSFDGIIDSDNYYNCGSDGGNYPFLINKGFEGLIPAGTPMYQMIPIKRESWTSSHTEYNFKKSAKALSLVKRHIFSGYKKECWNRKDYA
jgi:hypothetical protein